MGKRGTRMPRPIADGKNPEHMWALASSWRFEAELSEAANDLVGAFYASQLSEWFAYKALCAQHGTVPAPFNPAAWASGEA
jgi:hypothetical protein